MGDPFCSLIGNSDNDLQHLKHHIFSTTSNSYNNNIGI